jgi:hypothetical protein
MTAFQYSHRDRAELPPLQTLMPLQEMSSGTGGVGGYATQLATGTPFATIAARAFRPRLQHEAVHGKSRICKIAKLTCAFT